MFDDWSYEPSTSKVFQFGRTEIVDGKQVVSDRMLVMYAGQSGTAIEIVRELHRMVAPGSPLRPEPFVTEDVARLYPIAYGRVRDRHAYDDILAPDPVTPEELRQGRHSLAPEVAKDRLRRLQRFRLPDVALIIAGIDPDGMAHLWQTHAARVWCTDTEGFAVIGTGAYHAISRMMIAKWSPRMSRAEALLHAYEAKKEADEIVGTVGGETDMQMIAADTMAHFSPVLLDLVLAIDSKREAWIAAHNVAFNEALAWTRAVFGGPEPRLVRSTRVSATPPAPPTSPPAPPHPPESRPDA